jgi:hypothetical protein
MYDMRNVYKLVARKLQQKSHIGDESYDKTLSKWISKKQRVKVIIMLNRPRAGTSSGLWVT